MEILGYIAGKNLLLIAVNVKHIVDLSEKKLIIENAKKAFLIGDYTLLNTMGNPYKAMDIKKYILKLFELNPEQSINSIQEDLDDVFNTASEKMNTSIEKIKKILYKYKRDDGYIDFNEVESSLDTEEEIMLLKDVFSSTLRDHSPFTIVSLFGYEKIDGVKIAHLISIGNQLHKIIKNDLPVDQIYLQILDGTATDRTQIQSELIKQLIPFLPIGWQDDIQLTSNLIEQAKITLTQGIIEISPKEEKPNIVFYELSKRTELKFKNPEIPLVDVQYLKNA